MLNIARDTRSSIPFLAWYYRYYHSHYRTSRTADRQYLSPISSFYWQLRLRVCYASSLCGVQCSSPLHKSRFGHRVNSRAIELTVYRIACNIDWKALFSRLYICAVYELQWEPQFVIVQPWSPLAQQEDLSCECSAPTYLQKIKTIICSHIEISNPFFC